MTDIPAFDLDEFVQRVLAEDLGTGGDVTSKATIAEEARFAAEMNCREPIVVAGLELAMAFFRKLDPEIEIEPLASDGDQIDAGTVLLRLQGQAQAMLTAERSALNTLQHLSGIATLTRKYVDAIAGTGATLLDTRKTIPGLRALEKYAARMGGAENHRMRLDDGLLIKDNHVGVSGGVAQAVRAAKAYGSGLSIQVEVDRIEQIEPALAGGADRLLLDNMKPETLRRAVALVAGRTKSAHAEVTHRCVFHSAFGIYIVEELFGRFLTNSDGKQVFVRDVAEQHVLEDLGFIPSLSDWLKEMPAQPWMAGQRKMNVKIVD